MIANGRRGVITIDRVYSGPVGIQDTATGAEVAFFAPPPKSFPCAATLDGKEVAIVRLVERSTTVSVVAVEFKP
jgi:hypothetical protein